ncbi:MAG: hypothetical protein PWP31_1701 [Clostridia bacterium]|nr:hypothetical protein [Clostridia bacterium]MDK2901733.1 hypothetical protein [Thermosediminibacterales bacterium]
MNKAELYIRIRMEENLQFNSNFLNREEAYEGLIESVKEDDREAFDVILTELEFDIYGPLHANHDFTEEQVYEFMFTEMKYNLEPEAAIRRIKSD